MCLSPKHMPPWQTLPGICMEKSPSRHSCLIMTRMMGTYEVALNCVKPLIHLAQYCQQHQLPFCPFPASFPPQCLPLGGSGGALDVLYVPHSTCACHTQCWWYLSTASAVELRIGLLFTLLAICKGFIKIICRKICKH